MKRWRHVVHPLGSWKLKQAGGLNPAISHSWFFTCTLLGYTVRLNSLLTVSSSLLLRLCHICSCSACMGETQTFNSKHGIWSHLGERVWLLLANQKRPRLVRGITHHDNSKRNYTAMSLWLHAHAISIQRWWWRRRRRRLGGGDDGMKMMIMIIRWKF